MTIQIAVCDPRYCTPTDEQNAYQVGQLLADRNATVICGGGTGVMAAVAAGVRAKHGTVVGIRPSGDRTGASPDLSITLLTNMGEARNAIIVWSADAVIAIGGSWGTLSEIALAMRRGTVPVITLGGWQIVDANGHPVAGPINVSTSQEAVDTAIAKVTAEPCPAAPEDVESS